MYILCSSNLIMILLFIVLCISNHMYNVHKPSSPIDLCNGQVDTSVSDVFLEDPLSKSSSRISSTPLRKRPFTNSPSPFGSFRKRKSSTQSLSASNRVFAHRQQMSYADSKKFIILESGS